MMNDILSQFLIICKEKFDEPEFKSNFLDPIVSYIGNKLWPYVLFAAIMWFILMLVLVITTHTLYRIQQIT